ncbi:MAG TPA: hypothetical protein VGP26_10320 [Actinophytocola sp.]|jgi:hypothetical protein|nr:hypothetical protein [Actinophytocola sp.]
MPADPKRRRETTDPRREPDPSSAATDLVDELTPPTTNSDLVKGIVWADVLADIAADELRRRREVGTRDLPDAA